MATERRPLYQYWQPRYWPWWIGMGFLRLVCMLPNGAARWFGTRIGRFVHSIAGKRRAIVRRNIELCFPELSAEERDALALRHFEALGISVVEMGWGRWASNARLARITELHGIEHLKAATDAGQGVILLSAHFTTLEVSGRMLALESPPFDAVYRKNKSDFITEIQRSGREVSADDTIEKNDIKKMVRNLRSGRPVWYAPDQSYDRKGAEVVDFFGIPSMHTTATSTLARLGKAVTLPYFPRRLDDGRYVIEIMPPLENFPSGDLIADTKQYVAVLEDHIRTCPEQYFWIHKKFKNLPEGYPDYYADLDALK